LRVIPKAKVTEKVKNLASKVTAGKDAPTEQAKAIYDWVSKNITYSGNCIGVGAVVLRDIDVIIENKQGDCKDHATLLQALLKARGIESDQALINSSLIYELPKTPVVSNVNHVINYIPSLNVFVDSTDGNMPFGMLSPQLAEKPILLVNGYKEGVKTPSTAQAGHKQVAKHSIKIAQD
jgi:transglutaminase-like putative cysteine protease